jgi:hypothetical protein
MKRIILMAIVLLVAGFFLKGCNEPDRWHETNPAHGDEARKKSDATW